MKITPILLIAAGAVSLITIACTSTGGSGEVPAPEVLALKSIPTGRPDPQQRKNMIISPYRPYNLIDVSGYKRGEVVGDPSTAKKDPLTGKIIESTSKCVIVP